MSGEALFPELAPETEPERPKASCCQDLRPPATVPPRVWDLVHAVCHGRVPFTIDGFMYVANCTRLQAGVATQAAERHRWSQAVLPEPYMVDPPKQWVGCLPKRR